MQAVRVTSEPPRVSVVTPSYQMARFLPATIESVLSQDYPHLDYLVMDGGSTDGTRELLESYGPRLRYVSEVDDGQADAVNRGFHRTDGELFAFLNADDTYRPGAVRRIVAAFERDRGAGAVYGKADFVDPEGQVVRPYPTEPFDERRLAKVCFICQPAAFVTREAWAACDGLDPTLHYALDYDLWIRMSRRYRLVHVETPVATSRMHADNKTLGSRAAHYRETIEVLTRHFGEVPMNWLMQYAAQRIDGVDQFYVQSRLGRRSRALALAMALRLSPRHPVRTFREWQTDGFTDLFDDRWMSKAFRARLPVPEGTSRLVVDGRHEAFMRRPLALTVTVDGARAAKSLVPYRGPFRLEIPLPPGSGPPHADVELRSAWTWRPNRGGDTRRLSCLVDSVSVR